MYGHNSHYSDFTSAFGGAADMAEHAAGRVPVEIDPHRTLDSIHSGETEDSSIHFFGDQPVIGVISWRRGTDP